jgi:hypothetical protein
MIEPIPVHIKFDKLPSHLLASLAARPGAERVHDLREGFQFWNASLASRLLRVVTTVE